MNKINLFREVKELRTQLSYSKNLGFFFGAGTSCALKIPNVAQLTEAIENKLEDDNLKNFKIIKDDLVSYITSRNINIEDILNQIRRIRDLTGGTEKKYQDVSGKDAEKLDKQICKIIYNVINEKEAEADIVSTKKFFAWLSLVNKDFSKEIFTTNYDLIIEKSLEAAQIPYFDGFVGSYEPFFWQESIDQFVGKGDLTQNWIRLWKIHGSLSWFWKEDKKTGTNRVIRIGKIDNIEEESNELVIYPSKEKYDSSKKQPFISYFDRLKNYLLNGELLFVFTGYSFSDQHINEIIFNCLRQNKRLTALIFFFQDSEVDNLYPLTTSYMNLNVFGPTKAIINGVLGEWEFNETGMSSNEKPDIYWDKSNSNFILGDFNKLVDFLVYNSGKKEKIELFK